MKPKKGERAFRAMLKRKCESFGWHPPKAALNKYLRESSVMWRWAYSIPRLSLNQDQEELVKKYGGTPSQLAKAWAVANHNRIPFGRALKSSVNYYKRWMELI